MSQLNADHNYARLLQLQVAEGLISQDTADRHPERNALECFVGLNSLAEIDRNCQPLPLQEGDRLLLCSDGIDGVLTADQMVESLNQPPMLAAQRLCDQVLARQLPSQDNLTAVVLAYVSDDFEQNRPPLAASNNGPWRSVIAWCLGLLLMVYLLINLYLA
jgi:protein phosphatase